MEEPLPSSEEAWTPELIEFDEMIHAIGAKTSELSEETQERVEYFLLDMCDGVVIEPSQAKTASE